MLAKEVALMNLTIHDLPRVERPREKLIKYGPDRLSNAELLAIILRTGRKGENVLALSSRILRKISFADLPHTALADLEQISGIGGAKACELLASVELGKRIFENKKITISQLLSPQDVFDNLKDIRESKKEHFVVFFLDTRNQQIKREIISIGTINASLVHPREVFEPAVKHLAVQVILAHNHPSGDLEPSEEDLDVHKRLSAAGEILGIEVLDHIIVGKTGFMSFKEKNV
jgi:DNA repair protein RadC